jgi:hypothetical protein
MALRDCESFSFSPNFSDFITYGKLSAYSTNGGFYIYTGGPYGDPYLQLSAQAGGGGTTSANRTFNTKLSTFFFGFRSAGYIDDSRIAISYSFADEFGNEQFHVSFDISGNLSVWRGGTQLGSTIAAVANMSGAVWDYYEVSGVIDASAGSVTIRKNGAQVFTVTGVNTKGSSSSGYVAQVSLSMNRQLTGAGGTYLKSMHWYWGDNTGSAPWNTWLGDNRVFRNFATGNSSVQYTPNPSSYSVTSYSGNGGNFNPGSNNVAYQRIKSGVGGTLTSATITFGSSGTGHIQAAVYADTNGLPTGAPIDTSAVITNPGSGAQTFTFSGGKHIQSGTYYWVAILADFNPSIGYNSTNSSSWYGTQGQSYGSGFPTSTVASLVSNSGGIYCQMGVSSPSNYDIANMYPPIPATAYNTDYVVGHEDLFTVGSIPATLGAVLGIKVSALAAKNDAGLRQLQAVIKSGTTTGAGTATYLSSSPLFVEYMAQTDPNTGAQWGQSAAGAALPGYIIYS